MLRTIMITGTAICLSMGSGVARADHETALRYVIGGAVLGAALGELAYAADRHGPVVVDYGYGYGYRAYRPRAGRLYPRGRGFRSWEPRHRFAPGRARRHGRYCY